MIPYGHQEITEEDISSVVRVLRGDWLTTGPSVREFEERFAEYVGAKFAVSFSNGTAALHGAMFAAGVGAGDRVVVPGLTFAATSNAALYVGAIPVFADISPDTLCLDADSAAEAAERSDGRARAVVPVSYSGYPFDMRPFRELADRIGAVIIEDASHTAGGSRNGSRVGTQADMTTFSFHPVKNMTTGEGGMVTTDDEEFARRLELFRSHGVTRDHGTSGRLLAGGWDYDMTELGYNYRLTDIASVLGTSQLMRLDANVRRRREIAARYRAELDESLGWTPPPDDQGHAYHLYAARVPAERRREIYDALRANGIGAQVHYVPVYRQSWYRDHVEHDPASTPVTEETSAREISLPLYASLTDDQQSHVIEVCNSII